MPELPEIETVKLQLQRVLVGQKCLRVEKGEVDEIEGKEVLGVKRMGKVLLINFGKDLDLGFHFKMTGQLIYESNQSSVTSNQSRIVGGHPNEDFVAKMPCKHTRAIFEFEKGALYFNDMRKFGWIKINPEFTSTLGPDALMITISEFLKLLKKLKKPIKLAIMDQEIVAGVGNIYANDALWEAQINPSLPSNQLTKNQLTSLLISIKKVLNDGIKYGGASLSDYVDSNGMGGSYQNYMRVYKKENTPCVRCKSLIKKIVLGGRGTYYCPSCQYHPSH